MKDRIKTIGITGGRGFVGSHLTEWLSKRGFRIIHLERKAISGHDIETLNEQVAECDIIINLAGAPINKRWSNGYKRVMRDSRITTTRNLVKAIDRSQRVKLCISTSAVGIYPSDECYDESCHKVANTFLGELCRDWEQEARGVREGVRLVITRFGVVFSTSGGAYPKMVMPFRFGVATTFGASENKISWIDIRDLVHIFELIINDNQIEGVLNLTSPHPLTQRQFAEKLACYYSTLIKVNISQGLLKFAMGDAHTLLTENCCIFPTRLNHWLS